MSPPTYRGNTVNSPGRDQARSWDVPAVFAGVAVRQRRMAMSR